MYEDRFRDNLQLICDLGKEATIEFILAFKGYALWKSFPIIKQYINGATASSLHEARLCHEYMQSKAHTYCVAYREDDFEELITLSSHMTFNSLEQFKKFGPRAKKGGVSIGIRVNPQFSDVETAFYNPAAPDSRLGLSSEELQRTS